jgi:hypothetical protein
MAGSAPETLDAGGHEQVGQARAWASEHPDPVEGESLPSRSGLC